MRLLITGGAGCLGSELAHHFSSRGDEVCVFDNFLTGDPSWVSSGPQISVREGTVRNVTDVNETFADFRPSHVIHAAASYADPGDWSGDLETNSAGTLNVVKACESFEIEKLVYLQTALGYGKPARSPIPISHPLHPTSSYGISKVAGEMYALAASVPSSISLRLANVCAPRLSIGPLPNFYARIRAGEECTVTNAERDFLALDDFLRLSERILDYDRQVSGAFNVSTGQGKTIREVFETVAAAMGVENPQYRLVPIGSDDIKSVVLSPQMTTETFGWTAHTEFPEVVSRQVHWFEQFGVGTIRSHLKHPEPVD